MTIRGEISSTGGTLTSIAPAPWQVRRPRRAESGKPVTRRGRLVLSWSNTDLLELETAHGRFELLGPYGTEAHEGDEVEVVGLPDPTRRNRNGTSALLIQRMRRLT